MPDTISPSLDTWTSRRASSEESLARQRLELQDARNSTPGHWDAKIYKLAQELEAISKVESALSRELDLARRGRRRAQNALTAIGRIPDTVLADIFFAALESCDDEENERALLGAITASSCRFRVLALGTPLLWCNILIQDTPLNSHRTHAYFHRSMNLLLNLTFDAKPTFTGSSAHPRMDRLLQSRAIYLQRCKSLTVLTSGRFDIARVILPISYPMPELQKFIWKHCDATIDFINEEASTITVLDATASDPASVHIDVPLVSCSVTTSGTTRSSLKDLFLMCDDVGTMMEQINQLVRYPNLRSLTWAPCNVNRIAEENGRLRLRLDSLEMIKVAPFVRDPFLVCGLDTPCLRHLVIATRFRHQPLLYGRIGPFPQLRTLWFETGWLAAHNLPQFLHDHPSLETIGTSSFEALSTLLPVLEDPDCLSPWTFFAPRLSSLHILHQQYLVNPVAGDDMNPCYYADADAEAASRALRQFLRRRIEGRSDFKVYLRDRDWVETGIPTYFKELAQEFPSNVSLSAHPFSRDYIPHVFFPV